MNVKESLADRLVGQRGWMCLKRSPMFGIGPFLMGIEFVKIGAHESPRRYDPESLLRLPAAIHPCAVGV
jgi:hypothetical protein